MTQTLQDALLKAGLVTKEKLQRAEADKKAAKRAAQMAQRPQPQGHQQRPQGQHRPPAPPVATKSAAPAQTQIPQAPKPAQRPQRPPVRPQEAPQKKSVGFVEGKHLHHIRTHCDACGRSSPDVEYYEHKNRALDKYWLCVKCADDNSILDDFRETMQSSHAIKGVFRRNYGPTKPFRR